MAIGRECYVHNCEMENKFLKIFRLYNILHSNRICNTLGAIAYRVQQLIGRLNYSSCPQLLISSVTIFITNVYLIMSEALVNSI